MSYIIGIDEVGRGPLAGPVTVGLVKCKRHFSIDGLTDSKLMTEAERMQIKSAADVLVEGGVLSYTTSSIDARIIDAEGIEAALSKAIEKGLSILAPDALDVEIVLDGRLKAPKQYRQQSIIHGDYLVPAIGLAAVLAKIDRDAYMALDAHKKYPRYGFADHKGYGTKSHREAIAKFGPSPIHRTTFLSNILGDRIAA